MFHDGKPAREALGKDMMAGCGREDGLLDREGEEAREVAAELGAVGG